MAVLSKIIINKQDQNVCVKIPITSDNTFSKQEYKASLLSFQLFLITHLIIFSLYLSNDKHTCYF